MHSLDYFCSFFLLFPAELPESSSEQSTPTAIFYANGRARTLMRSRSGHASVGSQSTLASTTAIATATSTAPPSAPDATFNSVAWHRRSLNAPANATVLTECSFGVSHDKLLKVLTDVAPYEPCWKELRSIDLGDRNLDSLARLKEFLPQLDEARLQVSICLTAPLTRVTILPTI